MSEIPPGGDHDLVLHVATVLAVEAGVPAVVAYVLTAPLSCVACGHTGNRWLVPAVTPPPAAGGAGHEPGE